MLREVVLSLPPFLTLVVVSARRSPRYLRYSSASWLGIWKPHYTHNLTATSLCSPLPPASIVFWLFFSALPSFPFVTLTLYS